MQGPGETGAQIVVLALERLQRAARACRQRVVLLSECKAPIEVAKRDGVALGGLLEALGGVLAHGVEQAKALTVRDDERLFDQAGEQIDDPPPGDRAAGANLLGRLEGEAAGEHREATVKDALLAGEQVMAPVDRGPQRLLAGQRSAAPGAEHVEALAQARCDLVERQRGRAGRGELDRQRHAVQTPADLLHGARGAVRAIEARPRRGGALAEQPLGLGQRGHPPGDLVGAAQRLAARSQDAHAGPGAQNLLGQAGTRVDQVLAVVEYEHRLARRQMRDQRLHGRARRGDRHANGERRRLSHERGVAEARQVDEPSAVGQLRARVGGGFERQARLAAAPGAGERHEPGALQQPRDIRALALAADERGQLAREVAAPLRRRGRRRRQQLLVESPSRGVRLGCQLGAETLTQKLVLSQRLLAAAGARVQAHERAVSRLRERVGDQRALQGDHGGRRVAVQFGELEAQRGVQVGERSALSVGPRLVAVLGQQRAAVEAERPLIGGRVAIGSRARRGSLEGINVDLGIQNNRAIDQHHCGRAVGARGVERAAGGI